MALVHRERLAAGDDADGLLILHHGRGADESDLLGLGDALDPQRRLHVVTPRAPLSVPGMGGAHWYLVPRVGQPDPETFYAAVAELAALHDEIWERTGIAPSATVLGGFSMGTVMSYALGLGPARPVPAGILAFSGFIPDVDGFEPDLAAREGLRVFITHGRADPVIGVEFGRAARDELSAGGLDVEFLETGAGHQIGGDALAAARVWLEQTPLSR
ncbi:MAG TPA: phospholipase [Solirubrobacteraceae bacterium]|nr:phospholipase [Solirubrobacteraceae bacterium]